MTLCATLVLLYVYIGTEFEKENGPVLSPELLPNSMKIGVNGLKMTGKVAP